ncbi:MAG TPA: YIP1 family protein [Bacteroidota bacterium]|jgi:hypothetical protein|nr:YIP1 family protein [Bacteroidota bacterium]
MTRKAELLHLINIFAAPAEVAADLAETPRWRAPLIFMILCSALTGWFMVPAIVEPMRKIFISSYGEGAAEGAIKSVSMTMLVTRMIIQPCVVIVRWVFFAGLLTAGAFLSVGRQGQVYRKLFAFVAYAEGIFILLNIITVLVIYAKGIDTIASQADLTVIKGADQLLRDNFSGDLLSSILSTLTPFSAWYLVVITLGYHALTGIGRTKGLVIAIAAWIMFAALGELQSKTTLLLLSAFH